MDHSVLRAAVYLSTSVVLTGCTGPLSTLDPVGPAAASIATLWWVMLVGSAVLFSLVMGLFALVFLRPDWGRSVSPQRWILLGGLVLPAVVLPPLVAYGLIAGERLLPFPGSTLPRIEVHAEQWRWTVRYPGHGDMMTEGVVHLPAGTPVDIVVTSRDVIHSFWVPRLGGKIDVLPGRINVLRVRADVPGRYQGQCMEFCGLGHTGMRFDVIVHPAADFAAAIAKPDAAGKVKQ